MKRYIKMTMVVLLILAGLLVGILPTCATQEAPGEDEIGAAWAALSGVVPPEVAALLPAGFFESDAIGF